MGLSTQAGPAMSRCAQGILPTKCSKKIAPIIAPPPFKIEMLRRSATSLLIASLYDSSSGSCQIFSPATRPEAIMAFPSSSLFPIKPATASPSATMHAPVKVARSMIASDLFWSAYVIASPKIIRPSASVFNTSTVDPFRIVMMSPGRIEEAETIFSQVAIIP